MVKQTMAASLRLSARLFFALMVFALTIAGGVKAMGQVVADFEPNENVGKRPYEMVWANRKEPRPPTVTFSDLKGWRMEVEGSAVAVFRPSREQNVWDRPVGKLTYRGNGDPNSRPKILLYPPKPIPIPDGSDCVDAWIYGNRWGWENPPDTPPVQIFLHLRNDKGQVQRVHLTTVNWKEWWLAHKRLFPLPQGGWTKGWEFVALEIFGGWQPQNRTIYFDSLTFYTEQLPKLKFPSRPKRNLTLFEGQSQGLNAGRGQLEFPTREETILPLNLTKRFRTEVKREGNLFVFRYIGEDCTVTYRFDPRQGLTGITATVEQGTQNIGGHAYRRAEFSFGRAVARPSEIRQKHVGQESGRKQTVLIQPLAGAGVKFADGSDEGNLVRAELRNGVVSAQYENGVTYRLRLWQKSLVLDIFCRNENRPPQKEAIALDFGEIRLTEHPSPHFALRTVYVPFITYGNSNPVVAMVGQETHEIGGHAYRRSEIGRAVARPSEVQRKPAKDEMQGTGHVFVSIWFDWYRSNGSEPYAFYEGQLTPTGLRINGGVRYHPKTDGKRNDVFERVFVTVSPIFEEVLPVIPNPKGLHAHLAVDRLWQETWGPANYEQEMERSRKLRAYGIVKLIQCNHEITWRDGGESFTLRTRAAPGKGGDESLKHYLEHQKSLGWFAGLYTNYCDFAPVNEFWNPDYVQRTPEGEWRPAWPRCYALKPAAAVMLHEKLAPVIKQKFHGTRDKGHGPKFAQISAYTDVHTAVAPWNYCDYDARVPGAG
ncbi:MAG: hypothetical protein N3B10_03865, partial [Armatimonadetes bacterium]|nr:hypothetical protein [Armatimonadota bacterium]